jgi:hypothetical protein
MRPALEALAAQQRQIDQLIAALGQRDQFARKQASQITYLTRGLAAVAKAANIEQHVAAAMLKRADVQNPAQPVPEPAAEPAPESTVDAKTPEAFADVMAPGLVPGSTQDVAADVSSTVYTPGQDTPASPVKYLDDVTRPVDGTQGPLPINQTRTETDVRVGNPMNPQRAFPVEGEFANAQRLSSAQQASARTMASLRLARLRIQANTAEGNDFAVATGIEKDAGMTLARIEDEIATLEGVQKSASKRAPQAAPRGLVPKSASARQVPSLQQQHLGSGGAPVEDDDVSDLFL